MRVNYARFCTGKGIEPMDMKNIGNLKNLEAVPAETMERIKFSIAAQFEHVEQLRKEIRALLTARFGEETLQYIDEFCQVVSELVNNSVEHGACNIMEGELAFGECDASFTLTTDGVRFDPTTVDADMPDFDLHDELPEGGYGLAIINKLSDTFTYKYLHGRNMTTVGKQFVTKDT